MRLIRRIRVRSFGIEVGESLAPEGTDAGTDADVTYCTNKSAVRCLAPLPLLLYTFYVRASAIWDGFLDIEFGEVGVVFADGFETGTTDFWGITQ